MVVSKPAVSKVILELRLIPLEVSELFAVVATIRHLCLAPPFLVIHWWGLGVARVGGPMDRQLFTLLAALCIALANDRSVSFELEQIFFGIVDGIWDRLLSSAPIVEGGLVLIMSVR
jgi:hypothetical protein